MIFRLVVFSGGDHVNSTVCLCYFNISSRMIQIKLSIDSCIQYFGYLGKIGSTIPTGTKILLCLSTLHKI